MLTSSAVAAYIEGLAAKYDDAFTVTSVTFGDLDGVPVAYATFTDSVGHVETATVWEAFGELYGE